MTTSAGKQTLDDVATHLAPRLQVVSASQPAATLRTPNVVAIAQSPERARRAVLALERLDHDDDKVGTVG